MLRTIKLRKYLINRYLLTFNVSENFTISKEENRV